MSTRVENSVTLTHEQAKAVASLLGDLASDCSEHARKTSSAAVRDSQSIKSRCARTFANEITAKLWTWKD